MPWRMENDALARWLKAPPCDKGRGRPGSRPEPRRRRHVILFDEAGDFFGEADDGERTPSSAVAGGDRSDVTPFDRAAPRRRRDAPANKSG